MRRALVSIFVLAIPAIGSATPSTFGVGGGLSADNDAGINPTLEVFGRVGLSHRVGLQAQLARLSVSDDDESSIRVFTLAATYDLVDTGHWVPLLLGGVGFDWLSEGSQSAVHVEGGGALEYRADGGLTFGVDVRIGERSVTSPPPNVDTPVANGGSAPFDGPGDSESGPLTDGAYASGRLYAAFHF